MGWFLKLTKITTYKCDICGKMLNDMEVFKLSGTCRRNSQLLYYYDLCLDCFKNIRNYGRNLIKCGK